MNGLLGSYNLIDGLTQSIAQCSTDKYATATVNLCNRSPLDACFVDIAVTTEANAISNTSRYLEFNTVVSPKMSLERKGIVLSAGEFLTVVYRGDSDRCLSATTWAIQSGAEVAVDPIEVLTDPAPVIVTTSLPNADQDVAYSAQIVATDNREIISYTISAGALPDGLSLNSDTGIISGIPSGVDQDYTFTVDVEDNTDGVTSAELTITKLPNSTPPIWITTSLPAGEKDVAYSQQLEVDEIGVVTYSIASGSLPDGLTLSSSGLISGTPTGATENQSVTITATNASGVSANQPFSVTVLEPLYSFQSATFTDGGAGDAGDDRRFGPSLAQAQSGVI